MVRLIWAEYIFFQNDVQYQSCAADKERDFTAPCCIINSGEGSGKENKRQSGRNNPVSYTHLFTVHQCIHCFGKQGRIFSDKFVGSHAPRFRMFGIRIRMFVDLVGVSKANSSVDYAMLEYCIREDLKLKKPRMMAILDPVKLVIDNYPEDTIEYLDAPNNLENPELGERKLPFGKELYIEREDFMEEPVKKYFRLFPGNEVRLMNAYFVTCTGCEKDENGNVTVVHCTYDPETKSGSGFTARKVKGTIHWVAAKTAVTVECRLYENIVDEEKGKLNEDGSLNLNPNSLTIIKNCYVEPALAEAKPYDSYQFVRNGFFCADCKDSTPEHLVFNRIVSLKSSFKIAK